MTLSNSGYFLRIHVLGWWFLMFPFLFAGNTSCSQGFSADWWAQYACHGAPFWRWDICIYKELLFFTCVLGLNFLLFVLLLSFTHFPLGFAVGEGASLTLLSFFFTMFKTIFIICELGQCSGYLLSGNLSYAKDIVQVDWKLEW